MERAFDFQLQINETIEKCKVVIPIISRFSIKSSFFLSEIKLSFDKKKNIIPIFIEPLKIPDPVGLLIDRIQRIEFYKGNNKDNFLKIFSALEYFGIKLNDNFDVNKTSRNTTSELKQNGGKTADEIIQMFSELGLRVCDDGALIKQKFDEKRAYYQSLMRRAGTAHIRGEKLFKDASSLVDKKRRSLLLQTVYERFVDLADPLLRGQNIISSSFIEDLRRMAFNQCGVDTELADRFINVFMKQKNINRDETPIHPVRNKNISKKCDLNEIHISPLTPYCFSIFYPEKVGTKDVGKIIAFAHIDRVAKEIVKEASSRLGVPMDVKIKAASELPKKPVPKFSVIKVTPDIPGLMFDIQEARMSLWEDKQSVEFRFRVEDKFIGNVCRGWVNFWLESILIASLKVIIFAAPDDVPDIFKEELAAVNSKPYRKVFPSYSHEDEEIVQCIERYAVSFGDEYLRDVKKLRTGEKWNPKLLEFIKNADVLQLFWSEKAAKSSYVEQEWRYGLKERKFRPDPYFVRPVYWTQKPTGIPDELDGIQFARLSL